MLVLIKILTWIASPIGALMGGLLMVLLLWLLRWRKSSIALLCLAIGQLLLFSSAFIADAMLGSLEHRARALENKNQYATKLLEAKQYGAIVVLGGAMGPAYPPLRLHPDLNDASDRVWHAARLYRQGLAPRIIASGGRGPGLEGRDDIAPEALAMQRFLMDLGVPESAIVVESSSRTTRENAAFSKRVAGDRPIALVTSAFHMPRAYRNFENAGVTVDAFPTDFRVVPETDASWSRWLPSAANLQRSEAAIKEYLALAIRY